MRITDPRGFQCTMCHKDSTNFRTHFEWYKDSNGNRICYSCYSLLGYRKTRIGKPDNRKLFSGKKMPKDRHCVNCSSTSTLNRQWRWDKTKNGFLCNTCYSKLYVVPKITGCCVVFKKKHYYLNYSPRVGKCLVCNEFCDDTHLHHLEYDDNDILANTIEVCPKCHRTIHWMPVIDLEESEND